MSSVSIQDLLLSKFPDFNNDWADEQKLAWFKGFNRLLRILFHDDSASDDQPPEIKDDSTFLLIWDKNFDEEPLIEIELKSPGPHSSIVFRDGANKDFHLAARDCAGKILNFAAGAELNPVLLKVEEPKQQALNQLTEHPIPDPPNTASTQHLGSEHSRTDGELRQRVPEAAGPANAEAVAKNVRLNPAGNASAGDQECGSRDDQPEIKLLDRQSVDQRPATPAFSSEFKERTLALIKEKATWPEVLEALKKEFPDRQPPSRYTFYEWSLAWANLGFLKREERIKGMPPKEEDGKDKGQPSALDEAKPHEARRVIIKDVEPNTIPRDWSLVSDKDVKVMIDNCSRPGLPTIALGTCIEWQHKWIMTKTKESELRLRSCRACRNHIKDLSDVEHLLVVFFLNKEVKESSFSSETTPPVPAYRVPSLTCKRPDVPPDTLISISSCRDYQQRLRNSVNKESWQRIAHCRECPGWVKSLSDLAWDPHDRKVS